MMVDCGGYCEWKKSAKGGESKDGLGKWLPKNRVRTTGCERKVKALLGSLQATVEVRSKT